MSLILIGLRGSGKTTLGRALASRLGLPFTDLDDLTTNTLGTTSTSLAWRKYGEQVFRKAEVEQLERALKAPAQVLALGGGTPTAPGAAAMLGLARVQGHKIVYLRASAETLKARLAGQVHDRPSLTGGDPLAEVDAVLAKRDPIYLALADEVINTDGQTQETTLNELSQMS